MNRQLVSEPGVSAFLLSVLQNVDHISRMKPNYDTYLYYDPKQDLKELKEKLVFFQGLVVDGEAKRLDDPGVDQWMDDLNDLVYDVEDILDDIKSLSNDQVSANFPLLHQFSHGIEESFKEILARAEKLGKNARDLQLKRGGGYALWGDLKVTLRTRETSSMVDMSDIHGREEDKAVIVKRLLEFDAKGKRNYDVVGIWGMGGLGKTTLARLVYNDADVEKQFEVKSWVCISDVFDVARATTDLIVNFVDNKDCSQTKISDYSKDGSPLHQLSLDGLQRRLSKMVEKKKCLFVFDDVWSSSEWERMKAPFTKCANGSKILVTTRKINIPHALGNKDPYQLPQLDRKKCMELFRDRAFGDDEGEQEKLDLVEKIVRACGGVPLVVKVIGSMLQGAYVEKWRAVSENTAHWANKNDEIHPAIRLSYYDLPASLKRCFEYLAVFPPDFQFEQDDVVLLWIADGLLQEVDGRMEEDIGAEYYNELKARSLIQENDMMHDIVHHLARTVSRKFCCRENSKEPLASVRHAFLVNLNAMDDEFLAQAPCLRTLIVEKPDNALPNIITSCKMLRTLKIGIYEAKNWTLSVGGSFIDHLTHIRYLSIQGSNIRHLPNSLCMFSNLQFLDLDRINNLRNLPDGMNHLSNLRRLILHARSISSLPDSICALSQLQVLDLKGCRGLKQLPKDIGNLRSLQTLKLTNTSISALPESICALSQLQFLDLYCCSDLKTLPKDFGNLRSLLTLDLVNTSIPSLPESFCSLSQLQVLDSKYSVLEELPEDIGNLRSLQKLYLRKTFISSLPESICSLFQLQVLNLRYCSNLKELPKDMGNLRSLKTLDLRRTSILSLPESILNVRGLYIKLAGILLHKYSKEPLWDFHMHIPAT